MLQKIAPVLPASDISATEKFFRDKLKFKTFNYGNYLLVKKDNIEIHYYLWQGKDRFTASCCFIYVDIIEDLYTKFSSIDVINPSTNLWKNSWGKREFQITDNNGNVMRFGEGV